VAAIPVELKVGLDTSAAAAGIDQVLTEWNTMTRVMKEAWNKALGGEDIKTTVKVTYDVDDNGVRKVNVALHDQYDILDKLKGEWDKQNKVQQDSLSSIRQQVNTARQQRDAIARVVIESVALEGSSGKIVQVTRKVNEEWKEANQRVQALNRILNDAGGSNFFTRAKDVFKETGLAEFSAGIQSIVGTFQSVAIIIQQVSGAFNQLTGSIKQIESLNLTFKSIGQGAAGGTEAFTKASQISQNLGVNLKTTLVGFQQLSPVILASGGTMDNVSKIVEALSSRFVAFGKSADESKRIMNAVIQAFGKGKLMSEELNQQISEADPAFRTDLAKAIGVSVAELSKMVQAGKITNDVLLEMLPRLNKTGELFNLTGLSATQAALALNDKVRPTIEQVQNKINALNTISLISLAEAFRPVIGAVLVVQAALADFFSQVSQSGAMQGLGAVIGSIAQGFAVLTAAALSVTKAIIDIVSPVASLVAGILNLEVAGTKVSAVLGTIVTLGVAGWLASIASSAIQASADIAAFAQVMLARVTAIGNAQRAEKAAQAAASVTQVTSETAVTEATIAETAETALNTQSTIANTAAKQANAVAEAEVAAARSLSNGSIVAGSAAIGNSLTTTAVAAKASTEAVKASVVAAEEVGTTAVKSGGLLTGLRSGLAGLAGGFIFLNASIIPTKAQLATFVANIGTKLTTGIGAAISGIGSFIVALAPLLIIGAAIGSISLAVDTVGKAFESGQNTAKRFEQSTNAIDEALKKVTKSSNDSAEATQKVGSAWDTASKRVGAVQAALDILRRALANIPALGLIFGNTEEAASYSNEIALSANAFNDLEVKLMRAKQAFDNVSKSAQGNNEAMEKARGLYLITTQEIDKQIAALKASNEEDQKRRTGGKEEQAELNKLIAQRKLQIQTLSQEKDQLKATADARGINTKSIDDETEALKQQYKQYKLKSDQIALINGQKIDNLKERWEDEKKAINDAKEAAARKFEDEKIRIDEIKNAEKVRHERTKTYYEEQKTLVTEVYDKQIEALKLRDTKAKEQTTAQLDELKGATPAERELEKLRIDKLRVQAAQAVTYEERLQAQAQLERFARDKQAAEIKKQADEEEKVRQDQIKKLEEEKQLALNIIKAKEKEEDLKHQKVLEEFAAADLALKRQEIEEKRKNEDAERKARDEYYPQIKKFEKEIKDAKDITEKAQLAINKAELDTKDILDETTKAQDLYTKSANGSRIELEKAATAAERIKTAINNIKPMPAPSGLVKNSFSGGYLRAGESSYINELGKEAFLSNSGDLSWIDKPAWSIWKAPTSGNVIPAHIAAGLDIPKGGININQSTINKVNSSNNRFTDYVTAERTIQAGNSVGVMNNNVTISSNAPVQAASDMLVELTKLRRNRY
jgi:tape measure domain-containing protein